MKKPTCLDECNYRPGELRLRPAWSAPENSDLERNSSTRCHEFTYRHYCAAILHYINAFGIRNLCRRQSGETSFVKYSGGKVNGTTKWLANRANVRAVITSTACGSSVCSRRVGRLTVA